MNQREIIANRIGIMNQQEIIAKLEACCRGCRTNSTKFLAVKAIRVAQSGSHQDFETLAEDLIRRYEDSLIGEIVRSDIDAIRGILHETTLPIPKEEPKEVWPEIDTTDLQVELSALRIYIEELESMIVEENTEMMLDLQKQIISNFKQAHFPEGCYFTVDEYMEIDVCTLPYNTANLKSLSASPLAFKTMKAAEAFRDSFK